MREKRDRDPMSERDDRERPRKVYELAWDLAEARSLRDAGFGYETRKAAEKARLSPEIDPFYREKMKVFELEALT